MPEFKDKGAKEHFEKYSALALKLGVADLLKLIPVPAERIVAALESGDEHLNSISLATWDKAASKTVGLGPAEEKPHCPTCKCVPSRPEWEPDWPASMLKRTARYEPWKREPTLSLAGRVCVLKHVARYYVAGK